MCREFGNLTVAILRPGNDTTDNPDGQPPQHPFLTTTDLLGDTSKVWKLHGNGSHVLFADGHVKVYDKDFFPEPSYIKKANCWDAETRQWYNYYFANPTQQQKELNRSIAITP